MITAKKLIDIIRLNMIVLVLSGSI